MEKAKTCALCVKKSTCKKLIQKLPHPLSLKPDTDAERLMDHVAALWVCDEFERRTLNFLKAAEIVETQPMTIPLDTCGHCKHRDKTRGPDNKYTCWAVENATVIDPEPINKRIFMRVKIDRHKCKHYVMEMGKC